MIHVHRRSGRYQDRARAYKVLLDGQEVGKVKHGESVSVDATPGPHRLQMKIDWATSEPIDLDVQPDQDLHFECWPNSTPLTALYWITFGRNRYIGLQAGGSAAQQQ
jgi:hypothetical protein